MTWWSGHLTERKGGGPGSAAGNDLVSLLPTQEAYSTQFSADMHCSIISLSVVVVVVVPCSAQSVGYDSYLMLCLPSGNP